MSSSGGRFHEKLVIDVTLRHSFNAFLLFGETRHSNWRRDFHSTECKFNARRNDFDLKPDFFLSSNHSILANFFLFFLCSWEHSNYPILIKAKSKAKAKIWINLKASRGLKKKLKLVSTLERLRLRFGAQSSTFQHSYVSSWTIFCARIKYRFEFFVVTASWPKSCFFSAPLIKKL